MRIRITGIVCVFFGMVYAAGAQTSNGSAWVGVWQAELDGQPSAILTLADDTGTLEGTLVLNGISRANGTPHIAVYETHVLVYPKLNGSTLSFSVKGRRGPMDFSVEQMSGITAKMHCLNCGSDAPVVEMKKQN
jgi:hypothetical protein